jgi:hypothetical protein
MPAAPGNIRLSGVPAAESCDATPLPSVNAPASSTGIPSRHLTPVRVVRYQLFVEKEGRVAFSVDLPPTVTRFTVPRGVTNLARDFKFEIIARAANGNNTAVESCFRVN